MLHNYFKQMFAQYVEKEFNMCNRKTFKKFNRLDKNPI